MIKYSKKIYTIPYVATSIGVKMVEEDLTKEEKKLIEKVKKKGLEDKIVYDNDLSEEEEELIDKLVRAGFNKNVAITFVFLAGRDETRSREIEDATRLRQPEVSIAMQELKERGWVTKRDLKKEGKGRPVHIYRLDRSIDEIKEEIKENKKERIEKIEKNMKDIEELMDSIF